MQTDGSERLYKKALKLMPGGVSSPVRAIDPYPFYVHKASDSRIWDVDGNVYIDYCMGYGPLILGHAHPAVQEAVTQRLKPVSYTHLRAHETPEHLVCRLLLEKKKKISTKN